MSKVDEEISPRDDTEAIEYMIRRYMFIEHSFRQQWRALSAAGVKFSSPKYRYEDLVFDSAKHLQLELDRYAVCSRVSIWDSDTAVGDNDDSKDHGGSIQTLRRRACRLLYEMTGGNDYLEGEEPESDVEKIPNEDPPQHQTRSSRRGKGKREAASVTAALQSSDIYLRKKKKKRKGTGDSGNSESESNAFVFPTVEECREVMKTFDTSFPEQLESQHRKNDFETWKIALATGFYHLLFYGHGSKLELLKSFCESSLSDCYTIQIRGWDSKASVHDILELLKYHGPEDHSPLILVIHGLDALLQREKNADEALKQLTKSALSKVRLVGSVNHIDPPVQHDSVADRRFLYIPVHTHRPVELSDEGDLEAVSRPAARQRRSADRLWAVLQNLAPRYAEVLQVLADELLSKDTDVTSSSSILYKEFLAACRRKCLIDKDGKLRGLLQELKDHGLLVMRVEAGAELVTIPFDQNTLRQIVKYEARKGR